MENKEEKMNTTYSNKGPINLDTIPIDDTKLAIEEFAKGSRGLELCLRIMWQYGLKTYSCYPGSNNVFDVAYIVMEENEDVFSYLSKEFLNDEGIRIDIIDNRQVIKFMGSKGEKDSEMIALAQDILTGKKYNNNLLEEKIGEELPDSWIRRLKSYTANDDSTYWSEKVYIKRKKR